MRKLLFLLLLPCYATAQHEWDKTHLDSSAFHNMFGSEKEFQIQTSNQLSSKNKYRVFFIGYKWGYANNLKDFLEERDWRVIKHDKYTFFTYNCTSNRKSDTASNLLITFNTDEEARITKVIIKGVMDSDVINLYKEFWENHDFSLTDLNAKRKVSFNSGTDKVSLSWIKHKPVIKVTATAYTTFGEEIPY
jgi:hypothetical protein